MNLVQIMNQLRNNRKGYAWYMGSFVLVAMLVLALLFISKWETQLAVETVEDMTTSSALGAMHINAQQYSLFGDTVFSSDTVNGKNNVSSAGRVASPDKCFEKLQDLVGSNLGLTRTPGTCSYSGVSSLIDTETTPLEIKKAVFYNFYTTDGFIESYTYEPSTGANGYTCSYKADETIFPTGASMDNSGIYIEVVIPLELLGHHTTITKGQWVAAKFN